MNKDEIRKLIGGYASGTLTAAEQQQLFEAALDDQELFDELQKEQPLKELLSVPVAREQLRRTAADSLPTPGLAWFRRPWILTLGAGLAAASITIAFLAPSLGHREFLRLPAQHRAEIARSVPPNAASPGSSAPQLAAPVNTPQPAPTPKTKALRKEPDQRYDAIAAAKNEPLSSQTDAEKDKQAETEQVQVTAAAPTPPAQSTSAPVPPPAPQPAQNQQRVMIEAPKAAPLGKAVQAFRARQTAGALSQVVAAPYSISKRLEDGTYKPVPVDTVFHPNDLIRVTIFSVEPGVTSVEEWHAGDSTWHPITPPTPTFGAMTGAVRRIGIPVEINVKQGERLRVNSGSASYDIVIRTEP